LLAISDAPTFVPVMFYQGRIAVFRRCVKAKKYDQHREQDLQNVRAFLVVGKMGEREFNLNNARETG
jgi:hypothetical protein